MKRRYELENIVQRMNYQIAICVQNKTHRVVTKNKAGKFDAYCTYHFLNEQPPVICPYRGDMMMVKKKQGEFFNWVTYYRCGR
jgi:hypothetical protein